MVSLIELAVHIICECIVNLQGGTKLHEEDMTGDDNEVRQCCCQLGATTCTAPHLCCFCLPSIALVGTVVQAPVEIWEFRVSMPLTSTGQQFNTDQPGLKLQLPGDMLLQMQQAVSPFVARELLSRHCNRKQHAQGCPCGNVRIKPHRTGTRNEYAIEQCCHQLLMWGSTHRIIFPCRLVRKACHVRPNSSSNKMRGGMAV